MTDVAKWDETLPVRRASPPGQSAGDAAGRRRVAPGASGALPSPSLLPRAGLAVARRVQQPFIMWRFHGPPVAPRPRSRTSCSWPGS